jgi:Skp family chaperone for outer membrane proteins
MKQSSRFAVAFVALVAAMVPAAAQQQTPRPAAPAQPAPAQPERAARPLPPKGATIVVIDISVVARDSVAARAMRSQVDRQQAALRTEDEKTDKDLRAAEQELVQQRTILAPDAFNQRRRDFERRVTEAQQASQNKRRDLEEAFGAAQRRIETAVNEIVIEIAKENDYKVVVPRAVVVASHDAVDITDEVLQRLNRKVPSISLALPAAAPAPAPRR